MSDEKGAILLAEIGSLTTRVTLVDSVDGEIRMIGRAETVSSIDPPYKSVLYGVLEAAAQLSEITGRKLVYEGQLLMPQTSERDGVDHVIAISSAAGDLSLVVAAVASDFSARSAVHAVRSVYTSILQVITLDGGASATNGDNALWIERQVQELLTTCPDAIILTGGLEGGSLNAACRLAHIVALAIAPPAQTNGGRSDIDALPVIYAGNSAARDSVMEALSGCAKMFVVDNVRPSLERENLDAARREIECLYNELALSRLPGMPALQRLSQTPVTTVCSAEGLMTRFLAERYRRRVLAINLGAASSSAFLAEPGSYYPVVLGNCGMAYGLSTVLAERGVANIARWLPFPINEDVLTHWLLNKLIRPHLVPARREDLYIEHAIAREALSLTLNALEDQCALPSHDLIVLGGGVLANAPHPALVALDVLDVLPSSANQETLAIELHLDSLGLLPVCGALAAFDADAAVMMFDRDVLRNVPLATCVVIVGEGQAGEAALEVELAARGGHTQRVTVNHGQIVRLPLEQGGRGHLTLRPAPHVRIGRNAPGVEVSSDVAAIGGSALGVVIDARGRPLRLPEDDNERRARLWEWLVALGVEHGSNPYTTPPVLASIPFESDVAANDSMEAVASESAESSDSADDEPVMPPWLANEEVAEGAAEPEPKGRRISLDDLALPENDEPSAEGLSDDLSSLRATVEEPKKGGWLRFRKR